MNSIKIIDIKMTMAMLLLKDAFDEFFLEEAEALTYAKIVLNGKRNKNWYLGENAGEKNEESDGKSDDFSGLVKWKEVKHIFFEYIKGKKTPDIFKVSLKADDKIAGMFLADSGFYEKYVQEKPELHMQFRFEKGELYVITGIYSQIFTLDKSVENAWDEAVKRWFQKNKIGIEFS